MTDALHRTDSPLRLAVVTGSAREGRLGGHVTGWLVHRLRPRPDLDVDVVDVAVLGLPVVHHGDDPAGAVAAWRRRVAWADCFVFVVPEYNRGYPAALKHALDAVYAEWAAKPAGFVSYGGLSGGVRAVEQLRPVLAELHMVSIRDLVAVPAVYAQVPAGSDAAAWAEEGDLETVGDLKVMLDQLVWWAQALRSARIAVPYGA